uniref:NME/NM23 family member 9 n=2 Tax=Cyprinus carpio TaxID=7962 RepID=A0A9R1SQW3_CYPCA
EIGFFFPLEDMLAVIKPDTQHKEEILEEIRGRGFTISRLKDTVLSREMAEEFYREHRDKPFFSQLINHGLFLRSGPCTMMVLTKDNMLEEWRASMGPTDPSEARQAAPGSLRACFAKEILETAVHGSSNTQHTHQKIQFLFRDISTESATSPALGASSPHVVPNLENLCSSSEHNRYILVLKVYILEPNKNKSVPFEKVPPQ